MRQEAASLWGIGCFKAHSVFLGEGYSVSFFSVTESGGPPDPRQRFWRKLLNKHAVLGLEREDYNPTPELAFFFFLIRTAYDNV